MNRSIKISGNLRPNKIPRRALTDGIISSDN